VFLEPGRVAETRLPTQNADLIPGGGRER
jgi:hypothetical protein